MAEAREDFWPPELPEPIDHAPVTILKEQARLLASRTNGEIEGVVRMYIEFGTAYHTLYLRPVPLGHRLYRILSISHPVARPAFDSYPIKAQCSGDGHSDEDDGSEVTISDEAEFQEWLRSRLSSEYVSSTLGTLRNYIRSVRSTPVTSEPVA